MGSHFKKQYFIHETRETDYIRVRTKLGKWVYRGTAEKLGVHGKPRMKRVCIERTSYLRHRLMALAKDGEEAFEKFLDGRANPVLHDDRRVEDDPPNDHPSNVSFGTHGENRSDPKRKIATETANGKRVLLTNLSTGAVVVCSSIRKAAIYIGIRNSSHLGQYLSKDIENMPIYVRDEWDAVYSDAPVHVPDATEFDAADKALRVSPSLADPLVYEVSGGLFVPARFKTGEDGYTRVKLADGKRALLHRIMAVVFMRDDIDAKLSSMPSGSTFEKDIQVDHIDGDNGNNALSNLRVLDRNEHARKHALEVEWLDAEGNVIGIFECAADVAEAVTGVDGQKLHPGNVRNVCTGFMKSTGGRFFRYSDR